MCAPHAAAMRPQLNTTFETHEHGTAGHDWHVELTVGKSARRLKNLVLYLQECDRTAFAEGVPVSREGKFDVAMPLAGGGDFRVHGEFILPGKAEGGYHLNAPGCTTGERPFKALAPDFAESHHSTGTPLGHYPDLPAASPEAVAKVERLRVRTRASAAKKRFSTYVAVRRLYEVTAKNRPRPVLFHVNRRQYDHDGHVLDPRRPESLVYWWPASGPPVLVAFMYRSEQPKAPAFADGLLGWHGHLAGSFPMTHIWLTRDLHSAAANCMPVPELERDLDDFTYARSDHGGGPESSPCGAAAAGDHADHHHGH